MQPSNALYLFNEGRNYQTYRLLGAHPSDAGTVFRVWAPNAGQVSVVGDFNGWNPANGKMVKRSNGTASYSVQLEPGKSYRFRYMKSDGSWFNDEAADGYAPNSFGSEDCILRC